MDEQALTCYGRAREDGPMQHKLCFMQRAMVVVGVLVLAVTPLSRVVRADSTSDYPVDNGDLLRIAVYGDESVARFLSGDFRVGRDGAIKYPVLGSLTASGKTPDELARIIKKALSEKAQIAVTPAITVAEYAPVFLLGSVQRTGSFPYQPDMTVLQLILATGGLPRAAEVRNRLQAAEQQLADLEFYSFSLSAERARILAEMKGKDFDVRSLSANPAEARLNIIASEQAKFDIHRRSQDAQTKAYENQLQTYDLEINSLKKSIDLHDEEVQLVKDEVAVQQNLINRGLTPRNKLSDLRRETVVMQRQALEFRTALFRAQQNRLAVEQKLSEIQINADAQNLDRLHNLDIDSERTRLKLEAARSLAAKLRSEEGTAQNLFGRVPTYTILRRAQDTFQAIVVDESTKLQRGDIVRVDFAQDEASGGGEAPAGQ
jgi:polysaccharide biosynthesis/export protein